MHLSLNLAKIFWEHSERGASLASFHKSDVNLRINFHFSFFIFHFHFFFLLLQWESPAKK